MNLISKLSILTLIFVVISLISLESKAYECDFNDPFCRFNTSMQNMLEKFREGGVADDKFPPFKGLISSYPKIDMINKEDEIIISIDLPGVEKDNIELEIFEKYLTLSGKRSAEYEQKSEDYLLSEKSYGEFRRTVRFPSKVDIDKTETDYKDGVLKLVLPKIEPEKPKSRKIEI